jgi:regulatory protein
MMQKVRMQVGNKGFPKEIVSAVMNDFDVEKDEENEEAAMRALAEKLWRKNARLEPYKRKQKVKSALFTKGFDLDAAAMVIEELENEA